MGLLVHGKWVNRWYDTEGHQGHFVRSAAQFRNWFMADHGWTFKPGDGVIPDPLFDAEYLHQVYTHADSDYSGRVTVPVLWDKQERTVVSNESSEIIRMFNSAFNEVGALALIHHADSFRPGLRRAFQMQYPASGRLPEPLGLYPGPLPTQGRG